MESGQIRIFKMRVFKAAIVNVDVVKSGGADQGIRKVSEINVRVADKKTDYPPAPKPTPVPAPIDESPETKALRKRLADIRERLNQLETYLDNLEACGLCESEAP